jgi:hypothetical protein
MCIQARVAISLLASVLSGCHRRDRVSAPPAAKTVNPDGVRESGPNGYEPETLERTTLIDNGVVRFQVPDEFDPDGTQSYGNDRSGKLRFSFTTAWQDHPLEEYATDRIHEIRRSTELILEGAELNDVVERVPFGGHPAITYHYWPTRP